VHGIEVRADWKKIRYAFPEDHRVSHLRQQARQARASQFPRNYEAQAYVVLPSEGFMSAAVSGTIST
jgi:hypothetical protein